MLRRPSTPQSLIIALVLGLALAGCSASTAPDDVATEIGKVVSAEPFTEGAWSIQAVDVDSGDTVYELNPTAPLVPGSIQKTFTTGTALEVLGADSRITTPVHGVGAVADGTLAGDLVLVGRGDYSFGLRDRAGKELEFTGFDHNEANTGLLPVELPHGDPLAALRALARQVAGQVTTVTGDVIVDNRYFEPVLDWPDGRIDSIWVNENVLDVVLTPGAVGEPPALRLIPGLRFVSVDNQARTVEGDDVDIDVTQTGPGAFRVTGSIGSGAGVSVRNTEIDDPVDFARRAFIEVLTDARVRVAGSAPTNPDARLPGRETYPQSPLAAWESATTRERVTVVQKVSYNRGADLFACLIAVARNGTDCVAGVRAVVDNITQVGSPTGSVFIFDPAGSIDYNRTSARGQVEFLRGIHGTPTGDLMRDAFPVAGVDGSLASLGKGTSAQGKIRAKTGSRIVGYPTMGTLFYAAQSYSGYMTTESGRDLAFTIIFNATTVDDVDHALAVMGKVGEVALVLQRTA
ncbi:D-alanyl-D-alanine carboxypeptidase/D-alanyl-D-alanine-endopeptidase [Gordonia sp. NPDC003376]